MRPPPIIRPFAARPRARWALAWCASLALGCAGSPPAGPAPATASDHPVELSGEWSDVDAELVADQIIADFLASDWIGEWRAQHGDATPTLRLHPIKNRTTGYVDHRFFTQRFEAAIVRSGRMRVVLALDQRPRTSDGEDALEARAPDAAAADREVDFVMTGTLVSQEDRAGDRQITAYLATVEIVETATQRKAWIGQKRLRKLVERPSESPAP